MTASIAEVKVTHSQTGSTISIKAHDKLRALEALAKHTGVFGEGVGDEDDLDERYL